MKFTEPNDESTDSLKDLTVAELKDVCRACGLTVGGRKEHLVDRTTVFMESLSHFDGTAENVSLDE